MPKAVKGSGPAAERHKDRPVHPYSRKAVKLGKQFLHAKKVEASKSHSQTKLELVAEKFRWFQDNLDDSLNVYTRKDLVTLVQEYRSRFDEELDQIQIIQGVGHRQNQHGQHASREASIKITIEDETNQFEGSGIELPDLMNRKHLNAFRKWDGDPKYIQNLKLRKVSAQDIKKLKDKQKEDEDEEGEEDVPVEEQNESL